VGFASPLSPELIDKNLPPATPVSRGRQPKSSPGRSTKKRRSGTADNDGAADIEEDATEHPPPSLDLKDVGDQPAVGATGTMYGTGAAFLAMLAAAWVIQQEERSPMDDEGMDWSFVLGVLIAGFFSTVAFFAYLLQ
jgi:hypothetical protein